MIEKYNQTKSELKAIVWGIDDNFKYDIAITEHNDKNKISITQERDKRSLNANAYFHVLVNKIASVTGQSDDEVKTQMVLDYGSIARDKDNNYITCKVPKETDMNAFYRYAKKYGEKDNFDFYIFYKQTHTLDTKEMARLIDGVVSVAKELDIETLDDIKIKKLVDEWC